MDPEIQKRVNYWLTGPFDAQTKKEVRQLLNTPEAVADAFFSDLSFGTGGLRALMGPGTNRLNIYTIRMATQGLAHYLIQHHQQPQLAVVIGFDSRHNSELFARETARVLAGNGIRAYLLDALRPTPYVSFACREKQASAAVMITASHNPKEYNGYKVYWSDGAQVVAPHDKGIVAAVNALKDLSAVKLSPETDPLIERVPTKPLDAAYLKAIAPFKPLFVETNALNIVYTSLHGTGITLVPEALASWGFSSIHLVSPQVIPNGDFPTVAFPNPEYPETLTLCTAELSQQKADIALATDPDADRIGVVVMHQEQPVPLSGNEIAALCADFICSHWKQNPHRRSALVTTIVTTELLKPIAAHYDVTLIEVLTGFKYIGEKIHLWETSPNGYDFLFGAEESYGYLLGTQSRDKDAIIMACLIAAMAAAAKKQGQTLIDRLHTLHKKYGVYREKQFPLDFRPGEEGMDQMSALMSDLRVSPPRQIGDQQVLYVEDYKKGTRIYLNKTEKLTLPTSDVLLFRLQDASRLVIRPSGTEPKIKIYASVSSPSDTSLQCDARLDALLNAFKRDLSCTSSP
jgi:phosphomannomutase